MIAPVPDVTGAARSAPVAGSRNHTPAALRSSKWAFHAGWFHKLCLTIGTMRVGTFAPITSQSRLWT